MSLQNHPHRGNHLQYFRFSVLTETKFEMEKVSGKQLVLHNIFDDDDDDDDALCLWYG